MPDPLVAGGPRLAAVLALVDLSFPIFRPPRPADARVAHMGPAWVEAQGPDGGGVSISLGRRKPPAPPCPGLFPVGRLEHASFHAQEHDRAVRRMDRDTLDKVIVQTLVLNTPRAPPCTGKYRSHRHRRTQVDRLRVAQIASNSLRSSPRRPGQCLSTRGRHRAKRVGYSSNRGY